MSYVNISDVRILKNDVPFLSPFEFEITFECLSELKDDLEFKVIYVSSATNEEKDQVLESVSVGPIPVGINKFVLEAPPPNPALIETCDVVGLSIVMLHVLYMNSEFVRIGYWVNNEYRDEALKENPPLVPKIDALFKNILAAKPRVTRFHINWEEPQATYYPRNLTTEGGDAAMTDDPMEQVMEKANVAAAMGVASVTG